MPGPRFTGRRMIITALFFSRNFSRPKKINPSKFVLQLPFVTKNSKVVIIAKTIGGSKKAFDNLYDADKAKPLTELCSAKLVKNEYGVLKYIKDNSSGNVLKIDKDNGKLMFFSSAVRLGVGQQKGFAGRCQSHYYR